MDPQGKAVTIGHDEPFFLRLEGRDLFGVEHMPIQTCWRYDEDGYFEQPIACQVVKGSLILGDRTTAVEPPLDKLETHFLKWDGETWSAEKKPTTPAECAALGDLDHQSQTPRTIELRAIFDAVVEGVEGWRVEQDPETLAKRVVAIPEEETIAAEIDGEVYALDAQLQSLKDRMATAMLMGDTAAQEAIRAEYAALIGEE